MSANEIANRIHFMVSFDAGTGAYTRSVGVRSIQPGVFGPGSWEIVLEQPLYLTVDVNPPRLGACMQITAWDMPPQPLIPFALPFPPSNFGAGPAANANVMVGFIDPISQQFTGAGTWHVIGFRYPHF